MGGLCHESGTGCRSAALVAPLASSGLVRCEAVLHGYGTSPLEGGVVPICDSTHSWWLYSAASLQHQATCIITCYPTQSHYPYTEQTRPCAILITDRKTMEWQVSILKSLVWLDQDSKMWGLDSNPRPSDSGSPRTEGGHSYSVNHPDWYACMGSSCHFIVAWCTLRERQRSQNCDKDSTTSTH